MERERQQQIEESSNFGASKLSDRQKIELHAKLMEEYPLPWTIENLGPVNYAKVAKMGGFFDPLGERPTFRPPLDPFLAPDSPILRARAQSERVRLATEVRAIITRTGRPPIKSA